MRTLRIPLRAVFYRESDVWLAHCLEMDLVGDGASPEEAIKQLSEAVSIQVQTSIEHNNLANLFQPADAGFFEMFAAGKDSAQGLLNIEMKGVKIERMDTREYENADEHFAAV